MKKIRLILLLVFITLLSACNLDLNITKTKIKTETLNYISTTIMNSNIKISTTTYKVELLQKVAGPYKGYGSGVIIKEEIIDNDIYYYVLTNAHVIHLDDKYDHEYLIEDIFNNSIPAKLIAKNNEYDLAILKFKSKSELVIIDLANSNPDVFEIVFSVGSPSGKHNIITAGKIIAYTEIKNVNYKVIVHEAYIHKGSSGGMLLNEKCELVGINTWGFMEDDEDTKGNFVRGGATPIDKILLFLEEIELK